MESRKATAIFISSTTIELILIGSIVFLTFIPHIGLFNPLNSNTMQDLYLICFIIIDIAYIYMCTGTYSLYPTTFSAITSINFIFLFISAIATFATSNNKFKDLFYLSSCYIFLVMRISKCSQIFNHKTLQYKYKIHAFLYFIFIIIQWIQNMTDIIYIDINILFLLLLIFSKYTVDVIITFKIFNQLLYKHQIINFSDVNNTVIDKEEIDQLLPVKSESISIAIVDNKTNIAQKKIRQRFATANKNKIIQTSTSNPAQVRSSAKSIKVINEYKGNDNIKRLRSLYKKTHHIKESPTVQQSHSNQKEKDYNIYKLEEKKIEKQEHRKRFVPSVSKKRGGKIIPAKPKNIDEFIHEYSRKLYGEFVECFGKTRSHYIGICNNYGIEIEFVCNYNGNIKGKRIIDFKK